uniref:CBS domain containing membrane protein n=1 Tax=Nitratidesulfovibrio vulgaris (strain DSM 19637 / Miyazaki F) TaxID=883 RepID=B8DPE8_NITV9
MLLAKDIMTAAPVTVTPETGIAEAARIMIQRKFNGLPVVDGKGTLVGVICQSDLIAQHKKLNLPTLFTVLDGFIPLRSMSDLDEEMRKISATNVGQAMTPDPVTVGPETPIDEVASLMVDSKYHTLPVVDAGSLVGVIGKEDVLRTLAGA